MSASSSPAKAHKSQWHSASQIMSLHSVPGDFTYFYCLIKILLVSSQISFFLEMNHLLDTCYCILWEITIPYLNLLTYDQEMVSMLYNRQCQLYTDEIGQSLIAIFQMVGLKKYWANWLPLCWATGVGSISPTLTQAAILVLLKKGKDPLGPKHFD